MVATAPRPLVWITLLFFAVEAIAAGMTPLALVRHVHVEHGNHIVHQHLGAARAEPGIQPAANVAQHQTPSDHTEDADFLADFALFSSHVTDENPVGLAENGFVKVVPLAAANELPFPRPTLHARDGPRLCPTADPRLRHHRVIVLLI